MLLSYFFVFYLCQLSEADRHVAGSQGSPCYSYKEAIFRNEISEMGRESGLPENTTVSFSINLILSNHFNQENNVVTPCPYIIKIKN